MTRSRLLPFAVSLLAACGSMSPTAPATDASTSPHDASDAVSAPRDATEVTDAPPRVEDVAIALDRVSPTDVVTAADVVAPDGADASAPDVISPDVVDVPIAVDAPRQRFGEIYETILRPRCSECHGADRTGSAFIMRDAMGAYRALVDVPVMSPWVATCDYTERFTGRASYRVRPGDPAASMLYFLPDCDVRDAQHMRLTPEEREVIRAWILRGAPEMEL
jgi:mono/diheme cytochrome c family protein